MKHLSNSVSYCVKEKKPCVKWVEKYFKDCLCNVRDEFSFGFGFISLVCWGIAEIPQIVTNFRTKSSHGLSFLFLITWITGDVFNLVGCVLEPATLPTQFYTAVLYTMTTVVLVLQTLYYDHYDHLYAWLKCQRIEHEQNIQEVEEEKKLLKTPEPTDSSIPILQPHTELYYTSARSLARSSTPPTWSYLRTAARSGPSGMGFDQDGSSSEDETIPSPSMKPRSKPKPTPRSAGSAAFLAATVSLPQGGMALMEVYVGLSARRLLHESSMENNGYAQWLGWMMAAIYMGGRIPQICLNIRRGSVEGLNPLMFILALVANATYVASIVVRTCEWDKIKPNMPWLLDAVICVLLDLFIILQYVYYKYIRDRISRGREEHGYYVEANKVPLS